MDNWLSRRMVITTLCRITIENKCSGYLSFEFSRRVTTYILWVVLCTGGRAVKMGYPIRLEPALAGFDFYQAGSKSLVAIRA